MSTNDSDLARIAEELRADFDGAFARPYPSEAPPQLDILLIRSFNQRYALQLSEVAELLTGRRPVPVPSPRPDLLGLVGLRGVVLPVYDLSVQLGHPPASEPRFIAQVRARAPFAVAFEHFERHLRVPATARVPSRDPSAAESFVRASVRLEQYPLPVIDLPAIFESVTRRRVTPGV